MLRHLFEQAIA